MDFKEKIDKREVSASTSQVFCSAFQDLCENILQSPKGDGDIFSACANLQKRRQLKRGISLSEATLAKLTQHSSISIYSDIDFKVEFELQARRFWMDKDLLEATIERCSPGCEKEHAKSFVGIYGGLDFRQTQPPTDACIENFINDEAFSTFIIQQIKRMCYHGIDGPKEEIELLQQRENVEKALLSYIVQWS